LLSKNGASESSHNATAFPQSKFRKKVQRGTIEGRTPSMFNKPMTDADIIRLFAAGSLTGVQ
jgi:hypothetical protein